MKLGGINGTSNNGRPSSGIGGGVGIGGAAGTSARKLVIKPFKVQPKIPDNFEIETWEKLKNAIQSVYSRNASLLSKEELYRAVEDLCVHKLSSNLYDSLHRELGKFVIEKVKYLQNQTVLDATVFLSQLDLTWEDHCEQLSTIRNIFLYLDRSYALEASNGVKALLDLGNLLFRQELDNYPDLVHKMVSTMLLTIERIRGNTSSAALSSSGTAGSGTNFADNQMLNDLEVIGRLSSMLLRLGLYHTLFEKVFFEASRVFFEAEGKGLIHSIDVSRFLLLVDKRLYEAIEFTSKYIDLTSRKTLLEIIEHSLLKPHINVLMERGLFLLIDEADAVSTRKDDLKRMFLLFERVGALDVLKTGWSHYIKQKGESYMQNLAEQKTFVEDVLHFQEKLAGILSYSFFGSDVFKQAMKGSFEHFLNLNQKGSAEQVARYVDKKMRGEKGLTEIDVEAKLDQVMILFKYLAEKDIFEAFYKKHLSKRLLLGKSASYELEKTMLSKLKTECGASFTAKLEGMFTDVELSRHCQAAYRKYISEKFPSLAAASSSSSAEPELELQLLTTGYWPSYPTYPSLQLPSELQTLMARFRTFYDGYFQGRRLVWAHALERCVVTGRFQRGKRDLEVSLLQAIVLKCFNVSERLTFSAIKEMTGIEVEELKRTLLSLCNGLIGTRVLIKDPKGKDVDERVDSFAFNNEFTNKLYRIKINTIQAKETQEEVEKTHEEVSRDREYQVDAALVRIMKSRKRLAHMTLISETMNQLRFPAQNADIKKRIESLIERDYLERDPIESSTYKYLA